MATAPSQAAAKRVERLTWLIAIIAAIGFAFDSYVLLMLPLIVRPALIELLGVPGTHPSINQWVGYLFYVPAVAGGILGLSAISTKADGFFDWGQGTAPFNPAYTPTVVVSDANLSAALPGSTACGMSTSSRSAGSSSRTTDARSWWRDRRPCRAPRACLPAART